MRYLIVGDIHLSERPPSACTEDYLDDLFVILEHTIKLESELKDIAGVIWSGDIFHHKQPSRTSHRTVQRAIEVVQHYKKLWIVPGNHDQLNDRYNSIFETQPLGVLFQSGAKLLNGWESSGQHPIYGVPWKQHWDTATVENAFVEWESRGRSLDLTHCLVVAHAPLYPPSLELEFEYYPTRAKMGDDRVPWADIQKSGYCYYGHVHDLHGTYRVGDVTFCNQGAITRGSLHESELNRKIAVTTWSPEEGFVRVDVPHKPADQVFRLMEVREKQDHHLAVGEFLESIGQAQLAVTSMEAVLAHVKSLGLDDDVVRVVEELFQSSSG